MHVHRLTARAIAYAPAKLNLFFEVLGKRADGFHEIETLMVPIGLRDTLVAEDDPGGQISLDCRWADNARGAALGELPPPEANLAFRAVTLLRERAGVTNGLRMQLTKWTPSAAGLGGGSSDAAAALVTASAVWKLDLGRDQLAAIAAELGSDVPFFIGQGRHGVSAAICRGRGELIEPITGVGPLHFVVVRPPEGLATADVYRRVEVPRQPRVGAAGVGPGGGNVCHLRHLIHNRLQAAASILSPWIALAAASRR